MIYSSYFWGFSLSLSLCCCCHEEKKNFLPLIIIQWEKKRRENLEKGKKKNSKIIEWRKHNEFLVLENAGELPDVRDDMNITTSYLVVLLSLIINDLYNYSRTYLNLILDWRDSQSFSLSEPRDFSNQVRDECNFVCVLAG